MLTIETLRLTFVRSKDDDTSFSPGYQIELKHFYNLVRTEGIRASAVAFSIVSGGDRSGLIGEFIVPLAHAISPVLGIAAIAWLQGRNGRTLRLKAGDLEVEVNGYAEFTAFLANVLATKASESVREFDHD